MMDASEKIARQRLSVLELAEQLGNISEACRRCGMDRTSFYKWKRRFQTHGLEGLKDLPPIHKSHPQAVKPEVKARIIELALAHPSYGCNKLEKLLSLEGPYVSNVTIQKILIEHGLGTRDDRWRALEKKAADHEIELSADQIAYLEKCNPSVLSEMGHLPCPANTKSLCR
jgi:transposase